MRGMSAKSKPREKPQATQVNPPPPQQTCGSLITINVVNTYYLVLGWCCDAPSEE